MSYFSILSYFFTYVGRIEEVSAPIRHNVLRITKNLRKTDILYGRTTNLEEYSSRDC